jgi:hypothetical protein
MVEWLPLHVKPMRFIVATMQSMNAMVTAETTSGRCAHTKCRWSSLTCILRATANVFSKRRTIDRYLPILA